MAESVDALVSNTSRETCAGSIPALGTKIKKSLLVSKQLAGSFCLLGCQEGVFPLCLYIMCAKFMGNGNDIAVFSYSPLYVAEFESPSNVALLCAFCEVGVYRLWCRVYRCSSMPLQG